MPRGKYVNHKGRSRQFTPADELQRERIRQDKDGQAPPNGQVKEDWKLGRKNDFDRGHGVHSLIEISNPNRLPREKPLSLFITMSAQEQLLQVDDATQRRRLERKRERIQSENIQRSKEAKADLARLALVRQEREAAAERRLAAKKAAAEAAASGSETSLKKISPKPPVLDGDSPLEVLEFIGPTGYQGKARSGRKK
ncbi:28 kDa heat- and acid-stable phosphoprotein-like [Drosophila rhopaloa]|uniref:28 kDa heat- and acid-stable phosphoprotein-like n=1 Tax=Drosophila rhopaloa TaxID=1041015 RepID=A0A6P4E1N9_DRORH|nr:28 kDa heat- and acid-stable phosphoprotein-like [Drosophila rhopaloa]